LNLITIGLMTGNLETHGGDYITGLFENCGQEIPECGDVRYNRSMTEPKLSHIDDQGRAHMVDVSPKADTIRTAIARGEVVMQAATLALIRAGEMKKGDVLTVAQIAGIQGAKRTAELIPLCHPIPIHQVQVDLAMDDDLPGVRIEARLKTTGKTGPDNI
jgi:cyclic pyranopterin phosphate synthase